MWDLLNLHTQASPLSVLQRAAVSWQQPLGPHSRHVGLSGMVGPRSLHSLRGPAVVVRCSQRVSSRHLYRKLQETEIMTPAMQELTDILCEFPSHFFRGQEAVAGAMAVGIEGHMEGRRDGSASSACLLGSESSVFFTKSLPFPMLLARVKSHGYF